MCRRVVIFEVIGGNDKGPDGHRADSQPILDAFSKRGFSGAIEFYEPKMEEIFHQRYAHKGVVVFSRVNPGDLKDTDVYWQFLNRLSEAGALVQTHPEVMRVLSFKDLFFKMRGTPYAPPGTDFYASLSELRRRLPLSLATGPRVLKKNYTSTGVGVWKLSRQKDGAILCTEAADNNERIFKDWTSLFRYLEPVFHEHVSSHPYYFRYRQGLLDVPFLPGISQGEVRVFFNYERPFHILHKQPKGESFSATLFSGAQYTPDARLNRWKSVVEYTQWGLEVLRKHLVGRSFPAIWSIDSIPLDRQRYVFSDINAAAVGFTTPAIVNRISEMIADGICREWERDLGLSPTEPALK